MECVFCILITCMDQWYDLYENSFLVCVFDTHVNWILVVGIIKCCMRWLFLCMQGQDTVSSDLKKKK